MPHEHFAETIGGLRCKVLVLVPHLKMRNLMCVRLLFSSEMNQSTSFIKEKIY